MSISRFLLLCGTLPERPCPKSIHRQGPLYASAAKRPAGHPARPLRGLRCPLRESLRPQLRAFPLEADHRSCSGVPSLRGLPLWGGPAEVLQPLLWPRAVPSLFLQDILPVSLLLPEAHPAFRRVPSASLQTMACRRTCCCACLIGYSPSPFPRCCGPTFGTIPTSSPN